MLSTSGYSHSYRLQQVAKGHTPADTELHEDGQHPCIKKPHNLYFLNNYIVFIETVKQLFILDLQNYLLKTNFQLSPA